MEFFLVNGVPDVLTLDVGLASTDDSSVFLGILGNNIRFGYVSPYIHVPPGVMYNLVLTPDVQLMVRP